MVKKVFSVGYSFPGDNVETLSLTSTQSLLDADIILFKPTFSDYSTSYKDNSNGKPQITKSDSQILIEDLQRCKYELKVAFEHGKTIFIFLAKLEEVNVYTGRTELSGTGRNQQTINYVDLVNNYSFLPIDLGKIISSSGSEIKVSKELGVLSTYWDQFGAFSSYEVYLENSKLEPFLTTKVGNKVVGTILKQKEGTLILLPPINNTKKLTRFVHGNDVWTKEGKELGAKLLHVILEIDKSLNNRQTLTPVSKWASEETYKLANEYKIVSEIEQISKEISLLEDTKKSLEINLREEGSLSNLLFETGKPLEKAIIKALKILDFDAERYLDSDSEFDIIFSSKEGRFLGEAEGRDNKPINIGKLSQLERNINEDFEKEGVEDYAKGVLFGNAYRLTEIEKRDEFFTQKCIKGAQRAKVALVRTPDLFFVAKYLHENEDQLYAELCRKAIFETEGKIVKFPATP